MATSFNFLVFIGRFQPFHNGHFAVIKKALSLSEHVIVLLGSAHQPISTRNPWLVSEREKMIRACFGEKDHIKLHCSPLMDDTYNDEAWVRSVQSTVDGMVTAHHNKPHKPAIIGLVGHNKDDSSFYLNLFPQWRSVIVNNVKNISSTPIRQAIFSALDDSEMLQQVPKKVNDFITGYKKQTSFSHLKEEQNFVVRYQSAWEKAPYPPTFITVDAIVVQSGHLLLISRKARPGKGLLALPGGFVNPHEKLLDACLRELREETKLKVPEPVLKGSIIKNRMFDDPYRSARGRTITQVYYIELKPNTELPKVKGGDDAKNAFWLPLSELDPSTLFEDHYFIIKQMIGL